MISSRGLLINLHVFSSSCKRTYLLYKRDVVPGTSKSMNNLSWLVVCCVLLANSCPCELLLVDVPGVDGQKVLVQLPATAAPGHD